VAAVMANWPLLDKASFRPVTHSNIAYALMSQGSQREAALKHLDAALKANPMYPVAHQLEGVLLLEMGQTEQAESHLRRAIELEPDRALTYGHLAGLLVSEGRLPEAIALAEKSATLDPFDAVEQSNLAGMLATAGRCGEAIEHIQRAMELQPADLELRGNYGLILARCGRPEEAEAIFRQLPPGSSLAVTTRQNLAAIHLQQDQPRKAIAELERVLQGVPASPGPQAQLAWILATHPDPSVRNGRRAVELATQALGTVGRSSAQLLDVLAAAQAETGEFEAAQRTVSQAVAQAERDGQTKLARELTQRRQSYRQGRPWRQVLW
jgi:tetratricopeptide (TPR) repeat protein